MSDVFEIALQRAERGEQAMRRMCNPPAPLPDETIFGLVESEAEESKDALRALLAEITGVDPERILNVLR